MEQVNIKRYKDSFKWQFGAYPFFTSVFTKCADLKIKKKHHLCFNEYISNFENDSVTAFIPWEVFETPGRKIIKKILAGDKYYYNEIKRTHSAVKKAIAACLLARSKNVNELGRWWRLTQDALSDVSRVLYSFDFTFDLFLNELRAKDQDLFVVLLENIKTKEKSFLEEASAKLLKLKSESSDFKKVYIKFVKEFGWFQNSYRGVFKFDETWLKQYLKNILQPNKKDKAKAPGVVPSKYKLLVKLAKETIVFRDDKKKLLLVAADVMDSWLRRVCKEHGWSFEAMRWLTVDEILDVIENGNKKNLVLAEKYYKAKRRIGVMVSTGYLDISKKDWDKIYLLYFTSKSGLVKGLAANKGVYRGTVRVILDPVKDAKKFYPGDVLVASMTRPEYISLMSKAGAFVTDEGGISCHAAIVAREMGKPCIIGTRNATKMLKDGDFVEVDANIGIIKVVKN